MIFILCWILYVRSPHAHAQIYIAKNRNIDPQKPRNIKRQEKGREKHPMGMCKETRGTLMSSN